MVDAMRMPHFPLVNVCEDATVFIFHVMSVF